MTTHYGPRPGLTVTDDCRHCGQPVAWDDQDADSREPLHVECASAFAAERAQAQADNLADAERERAYADNAADADSDTATSEGGTA